MTPPFIFNHDGFGMLAELADTAMTPADAARVLVEPLAGSAITAIDWCLCSTGVHNCRTRFRLDLDRRFVDDVNRETPGVWASDPERRLLSERIARVVEHYNAQDRDLLDVVIDAGHAAGLKVYGCVRLNHANGSRWLQGVPGRAHANGTRRDFRDPAFHDYLLALYTDLLERDLDGISLDFERKAPFFPDDAPLPERAAACTAFLRRARALTDKPLIVRISHQREKGAPQGQSPEAWLAEGLVDIVVPATHNHDPDPLDWTFDRFREAAAASPRPCQVMPQIWPTPTRWLDYLTGSHPPEAIARRMDDLLAQGADGGYFFNFCCFGSQANYFSMFRHWRPSA